MFLFLLNDIREGFRVVKTSQSGTPWIYLVFALNLLTQLVCVSGVNQLASVCISDLHFHTLLKAECSGSALFRRI